VALGGRQCDTRDFQRQSRQVIDGNLDFSAAGGESVEKVFEVGASRTNSPCRQEREGRYCSIDLSLLSQRRGTSGL
jgi:hypothetical protein